MSVARKVDALPLREHFMVRATVRCPWCGLAVMEIWLDGTTDELIDVTSAKAANDYWAWALGDFYPPEVWCQDPAHQPWILLPRDRARVRAHDDNDVLNLRARRGTRAGK